MDEEKAKPKNDEEHYDVDNILETGGVFNLHQILILMTSTGLCLFTCYNNLLSFFTGHSPSWRCTSNNNSDQFCMNNANTTFTNTDQEYNQRCILNRSAWEYTTSQKYSFVTEFDLVCKQTYLAALIGASFYIGGIFGCMSGTSADMFGRKPIILLSTAIVTLSSIGSSFITKIWQLIILNLLRGAGCYGTFICCTLYQAEFSPPSFRPIATNILLLAFAFSFFYLDLIAYYVREWRYLSSFAALPGVLLTIVIFCLPESPRWLLVNGQTDRAKTVLEKFSKVKHEPTIITRQSSISEKGKEYSVFDLFRNSTVLKVITATGALWVACPTVYYTIAMESSDLGGDMYQAFALTDISDCVAYLICMAVQNRVGRKQLTLAPLSLSGILLGLILVIPRSFKFRYMINITIMIFARLNIVIATSFMFVWTSELFPTVLRSRGIFICAICDRIGTFSVPFIIRVLQQINNILPYVITGVLAIIASVIALVLPETNGKPTREVYDDFFEKPIHVTSYDNKTVDVDIKVQEKVKKSKKESSIF